MNKNAPFHPCMNNDAHDKVARIHLPVAPECNIHCRFCARKVAPQDSTTRCPGLTTRVLAPNQALEKARKFIEQWGPDAIVGIAGPGDPLANPQTFVTLDLIRKNFPDTPLCLCTNGLLLPGCIDKLKKLNMHHLSLTVNGVDPEIICRITPWIIHDNIRITGLDGAKILIKNQLAGIRKASAAGMFVKVNTVVVSSINEAHVMKIAETVKAAGTDLYNPVPLIPGGSLKNQSPPNNSRMHQIRKSCEQKLPVFYKCKQCRADAEGIPGQEACA